MVSDGRDLDSVTDFSGSRSYSPMGVVLGATIANGSTTAVYAIDTDTAVKLCHSGASAGTPLDDGRTAAGHPGRHGVTATVR
jgi:hypothetical protein